MSDPGGRPTSYTDDIAQQILERMGQGESLRAICRDEGTPGRTTVKGWIRGEGGAPASFPTQYAHARELRAEHLAEEALEIADEKPVDNVEVQALRLRVDTRKWAAGRMDSKNWGDRTAVDVGGQRTNPMTVAPLDISHLSDEDQAELKRLNAKVLMGGEK